MWLIIPADLLGTEQTRPRHARPLTQLLETKGRVGKDRVVKWSSVSCLSNISPLNNDSSDSNFGQSLHCHLRKMNVSLSLKAVQIHRLSPLLSSSEPYEFVSLEWLQKWLDESTPTKPIDNHACLCSHDKLHPDKISIMKRISEYAADVFYSRYGGGPRLTGNFRCLLYFKKRDALRPHHVIFMIIGPKLGQTKCSLHRKKDLLNKVEVALHMVYLQC